MVRVVSEAINSVVGCCRGVDLCRDVDRLGPGLGVAGRGRQLAARRLSPCRRPASGVGALHGIVFCTVFGPTAFRIVGLVLIIWLLARRYLRAALFLVVSVEISGLVTEVAKSIADRPRPDTPMVYPCGTSFPSGHALGVMVAVLALLTVALPLVASRWRLALAILGAVVVIAVGIGRVALNVHHPSDVVAGWALGYLYYLLCVVMVRPLPLTQFTPRGERRAESGTAP